MRASILIAAHNEGDSLWKTVRACVETCGRLDHEIIVADDASTDHSVAAAYDRYPHVRVVHTPERRGASPTKHLAARSARGEVLVFLDGHCHPEPGAIEQLIADVESLAGRAIVTPRIPALDVQRWRNSEHQVGHGYRLGLEKLDCGWLPLGRMRAVRQAGRAYYESPALIGCVLAVGRELYDELRGFDPHMFSWGVEDLDFGLKCWLMGYSILHDPEASIGHRFRQAFDNYDVSPAQLTANQLRMARKNFTPGVWRQWLDACRCRSPQRLAEHPEGLWAHAWQLFREHEASAEAERSYLHARRVRDEFWYAERFELSWPKLETVGGIGQASFLMGADPSPSPGPVEITFSPNPIKLGFTKPVSSSPLRRSVTVNVAPAASAKDVTFDISGAPRATIFSIDTTEEGNGVITIYLKGIDETPSDKTEGDTWLDAKLGGTTINKLPIIVVVPKKTHAPYPEFEGDVAPQNLVGDRSTSPVWFVATDPPLGANQVGLATVWIKFLAIRVDDQFGNALDSIYDGSVVEEKLGGTWIDINQIINASGVYNDPVGKFRQKPIPAGPPQGVVLRDSAAAMSWPTDPTLAMIPGTETQNIGVRVGGHEIDGIINRKVTTTAPNHLKIEWPSP